MKIKRTNATKQSEKYFVFIWMHRDSLGKEPEWFGRERHGLQKLVDFDFFYGSEMHWFCSQDYLFEEFLFMYVWGMVLPKIPKNGVLSMS